MNELTTYTFVASLVTIPPVSVTFLDIRRDPATYPKVTAVPREVAIAALTQIILRAAFNAAPGTFRADDNDERIALMAAELYELLVEDYYHLGTDQLSFAEVARVLRSASAGRELYGVNVRSLYSAILDYCEGPGQKASRQLQAEIWSARTLVHQAPATAPTEEERTALATVFDNFMKNHKSNK